MEQEQKEDIDSIFNEVRFVWIGYVVIMLLYITLIVLFPFKDANAALHTAQVKGVYDGDTITVDIALGFGVILANQKVRLEDINAPEVRGSSKEDGIKSRDWLRARILGKFVILDTRYKKGKYGRWIAYVLYKDMNLNKELVRTGHAVTQHY